MVADKDIVFIILVFIGLANNIRRCFMEKVKGFVLYVFFLLLGALPLSVGATDVDSTATFTVTLSNSCQIDSISNISIDYNGKVDATGNGAVNVTCSNGLPYTAIIGGGNNASGELRRAANGGNYLSYRLYKDAGLTQELQVTANNTISGTGNGTTQATTIYGSVKKADNAGAVATSTSFTDTVSITVSF